MWNGGLNPINPAADGTSQDLAALEAALKAEEGRLGDLKYEGEEAGVDARDAHDELIRVTNEARNREQVLESEKNKREEFVNRELKTLSDRIGVSEERLRGAWDLARFYQEYFDREIKASIGQALTELDVEQRAAWDEIIRVLHAVFSKFSSTITETRSSADTSFRPERYFNRKEPPQNEAPRRAADAQAQQRELDAEKRQLQEAAESGKKFYDDRNADAKQKLAAAEDEKKNAEAEDKRTAERRERVKAEFEAHRSKFSELERQKKAMERQLGAARGLPPELPSEEPPETSTT